MKVVAILKSWWLEFNRKRATLLPEDVEALCPKCFIHTAHKVEGPLYICKDCGTEQKASYALTREETSW